MAPPNSQSPSAQWATANGFSGQRGRLLPLPARNGGLAGYLFGIGPKAIAADPRHRPRRRSPGAGHAIGSRAPSAIRPSRRSASGSAPIASTATRPQSRAAARAAQGRRRGRGRAAHRAAFLARDLINTPANDLGPEPSRRRSAPSPRRHKMKVKAIVGDDLLKQNFPMIHAVGRAAAEAPRLLDLTWGKRRRPQDHPGRQGRHLRYRRPRHQAVRRACC